MDIVELHSSLRKLREYDKDLLAQLYVEEIGPIENPALHRMVMVTALGYKRLERHHAETKKPIPKHVQERMAAAYSARCFKDLMRAGLVLSSKEKYMGGVITSECPAFRKSWSEDAIECKECKEEFPDEYEECKRSCSHKTKATATPNKPEDQEVKPFKGFKKGSRADIILEALRDSGTIEIAELAKAIALKFKISEKDAASTIKSYVGEWATGCWGYVKRDFPWEVSINASTIAFKEKK